MGRVRRIAATVASAAALAGCALLSGAGDLTVADAPPANSGGTDGASVGLDGGATGSDGAMGDVDGSTGSTDGALADAGGGEGGSRLRNVTFEDGTLLGLHGGDSTFGQPSLVGFGALAGNNSMRVDKNGQTGGIQVGFAPVDELFATALVRLENLTNGPLAMFAFDPQPGGVTVELRFSDVGPLSLVVGGNVVGSGGDVGDNSTHRIGFHLRQDATSSFVEVFVATNATGPFGPAAIATTTVKLGPTIAARMGGLEIPSGAGNKVLFDNLILDTLSMPAP